MTDGVVIFDERRHAVGDGDPLRRGSGRRGGPGGGHRHRPGIVRRPPATRSTSATSPGSASRRSAFRRPASRPTGSWPDGAAISPPTRLERSLPGVGVGLPDAPPRWSTARPRCSSSCVGATTSRCSPRVTRPFSDGGSPRAGSSRSSDCSTWSRRRTPRRSAGSSGNLDAAAVSTCGRSVTASGPTSRRPWRRGCMRCGSMPTCGRTNEPTAGRSSTPTYGWRRTSDRCRRSSTRAIVPHAREA